MLGFGYIVYFGTTLVNSEVKLVGVMNDVDGDNRYLLSEKTPKGFLSFQTSNHKDHIIV